MWYLHNFMYSFFLLQCSLRIKSILILDFSHYKLTLFKYINIQITSSKKNMQNRLSSYPLGPAFSSNNPKTDHQFFNGLKKYNPLFYSGKGTPLLMTNQNWHQSLMCVGVMDLLYIAALILFITKVEKNQDGSFKGFSGLPAPIMLLFSILILLFANILMLLTQLFNPGIMNPSSITDSQYIKNGGKKWCRLCSSYVLENMEHCLECEVCIWGLDHHCGYFNKCIGGYQKFFFYGALTFAFLGFINIIILASSLAL